MKQIIIFISICLLLVFYSCSLKSVEKKEKIVVYCAASLSEIVSEISDGFESEFNADVLLNMASSGTLARQIENGANCSVFISADNRWIEFLNKQDLLVSGSEKKLAGNSMVLVTPATTSICSFRYSDTLNLPGLFNGRISIGDPGHVPAGTYAVQIFEKMGCREEMEVRFLPAKDVKSALMVVELGEVDAGIVYKTDALQSGKVKIITEFPDSLHDPVLYRITMVKNQDSRIATEYYNYIRSEKIKEIWKKHGFKTEKI